jgi:hypothetical protein
MAEIQLHAQRVTHHPLGEGPVIVLVHFVAAPPRSSRRSQIAPAKLPTSVIGASAAPSGTQSGHKAPGLVGRLAVPFHAQAASRR